MLGNDLYLTKKKKKKDVHALISGTVSTLPAREKGTLQVLFNYKP